MLEKKALCPEDIEAQTALELPSREMMALVNLVAFDVVDVNNNNVGVGAQVPANVCGVGVLSTDVDGNCQNDATQDVTVGRR